MKGKGRGGDEKREGGYGRREGKIKGTELNIKERDSKGGQGRLTNYWLLRETNFRLIMYSHSSNMLKMWRRSAPVPVDAKITGLTEIVEK